MASYLIEFDVDALSMQLSHTLGCEVSAKVVREILSKVGWVECRQGWLTRDLRPLALAYVRPNGLPS